jgi:hypothetical protein
MLSNVAHRSRSVRALFALLIATLVSISVWLGLRTQHYPVLNDFWALLFQSSRFDWSHLDSFKNGFFPPGYGVFLSLIGGKHVLANAYYASLSFAAGTLLVTYWATERVTTSAAALAAAALTAFYPLNFSLMMTSGPDIGCVFMLWTAFCLLHVGISSEEGRTRAAAGWAAGLLFSVAILWRYHALVYASCALIAVFCVTRGPLDWRAGLGVGVALLVLASLSLLPGFSEQLARAQAFNVWKALHPVNWYHMPRNVPQTVGAVVWPEHSAFVRVYWEFNRPYLWLLVPPLIAALVARERQRHIAVSILVLELLYLPVVGIGFSPRGVALIIPATMLCVGLLIGEIQLRLSSVLPPPLAAALPLVILTGFFARPWWNENRGFIHASIAGYEWRRDVELELRAQGVKHPLQVFSDAGLHFVLYPGPGWYSYLTRGNGGWPRLDMYDLERLAPEFRTDSLAGFVEDCQRSGITHVVLSPTSGALLPELAHVFSGQRFHPNLQYTSTVRGLKVFALQP